MGVEPGMSDWKDPTQEDTTHRGSNYAYTHEYPTTLPQHNTGGRRDVCKLYPFNQRHLPPHKVHDGGTHSQCGSYYPIELH